MAARRSRAGALVGMLLGCLWPLLSPAADSQAFHTPARAAQATDRIIVKWRTSAASGLTVQDRAQRAGAISAVPVTAARNLFGRTDVFELNQALPRSGMQALLTRLNADPGVEYAEPDGYRYIADFPANAAPNDPFFVAASDQNGSWNGQWYLLASSSATPSAISATTAWQTTLGAPSVVVAVIDSGIIESQPDFTYPSGTSSTPKLACTTDAITSAPYCGYDFVSCDQGNNTSASGDPIADCSATGSAATYYFANNGHGWAEDASDPGDWIDSTDTAMTLFQDAGCTATEPSSWHGTKVAGVIGAVTNNGVGIAGIAPNTTLLPVRALGKCSGRVSDIAAAILWAAGIAVTGVPTNITPANIINISLAGNSACSSTEQDAITQAIAAGVLVVVAAGNEGGPLDAPANCSGVLSVVGLRHAGTKVPYSDLSSTAAAATIAAPGGNCVNTGTNADCLYAIGTTTDEGSSTPVGGFYSYEQFNQSFLDAGGNPDNAAVKGTSFAAPMVSGVAALMLAVSPGLTPAQLITRLQSSALPFPTSSSTTSTQCALASTATDSNGDFTDTSQDAECVCTTATCGAGMLNAAAAVNAATGEFAEVTTSDTSASPGQHVRLDGSASTPSSGDTIVSYRWSTIPATSDQIINSNQAVASLVMPAFRTIQVQLTIVDSGGHAASASATIRSAIGAASGVGALDWSMLLPLLLLALWRLFRRPYLN